MYFNFYIIIIPYIIITLSKLIGAHKFTEYRSLQNMFIMCLTRERCSSPFYFPCVSSLSHTFTFLLYFPCIIPYCITGKTKAKKKKQLTLQCMYLLAIMIKVNSFNTMLTIV